MSVFHHIIYTCLAIIFPGEPVLASSSLRLFLSIILFTVLPCPSQTGEGTAVKEEEWRESTLHHEE